MKRVLILFCVLVASVADAAPGRTSLSAAPYFSRSMILQRDIRVPVWGSASAGTVVTVSFQGQTSSATATSAGKWLAWLNPLAPSQTPATLTVSGGGNTLSIGDVLVGDVWVISGQSNVVFALKDADGGADAIATSGSYPTLRRFLIAQNGQPAAAWEVSAPNTTAMWSAVGFFFGRALYNLMSTEVPTGSVPIGIIQAAKGGTSIAEWTTFGGGNGRQYLDKIRPLQPYAIRGVLWYQGEDDSRESTAQVYYTMLPGLIANWRADWGQGTFPFNIVQLPPVTGKTGFPIVRDAQVSALDVSSGTALACTIDVPTVPPNNLHPPNKEPVGQRLALAALEQVYPPSTIASSGPIRSVSLSSRSGSSIFVEFTAIDGGLLTSDGAPPGPFLIAGANGVYYPATANIYVPGGSRVEVSNPAAVPVPTSVRYCWDPYPICNLYNDNDNDLATGVGLPASPFQLTIP